MNPSTFPKISTKWLAGLGCAALGSAVCFGMVLVTVVFSGLQKISEGLALQSAEERQAQAQEYVSEGNTAFYEANNYNAALKAYERAYALDEANVEALLGIGNVYHVKSDYETAIEYYDQAIQLAPTYGYAYLVRGNSYFLHGAYSSAIQDYEAALTNDYSSTIIYLGLAAAYDELGEYDEAVTYYQKYLEVDAGDNEVTRYACNRVNFLASFVTPDNWLELFANLAFSPCDRFASEYTGDYDPYAEEDDEDYYLFRQYYNPATGQNQDTWCSGCKEETIAVP